MVISLGELWAVLFEESFCFFLEQLLRWLFLIFVIWLALLLLIKEAVLDWLLFTLICNILYWLVLWHFFCKWILDEISLLPYSFLFLVIIYGFFLLISNKSQLRLHRRVGRMIAIVVVDIHWKTELRVVFLIFLLLFLFLMFLTIERGWMVVGNITLVERRMNMIIMVILEVIKFRLILIGLLIY